ncbi:cuticular protein 3 [Ptiloglossa arizonensis]|uniref:cuticular protein 3 n=1 Tax=Ptiloglossa arizonensis TaxID=3350558 RepID=UPI003FA0429A
MAGKLIVLLSLAAISKAALIPAAKLEELDSVPRYSFAYDVQDAVTGDSKAQYETRNGDVVQGSYSLIEADGTRRIVEYTADPINGFNAVVSREPATAVAAIAAPLVPYAPGIVASAAGTPVLPAAGAPAPPIPASGPDSDVEVVEARSGPLVAAAPTTREQQLRQQQEQQLQQLQDIERQQREQQQQQIQQQSRLQLQQQIQSRQQERLERGQEKRQEQEQPQRLQRLQRVQQQPQDVPVKAVAAPLRIVPKAQQLIQLPGSNAITSYTNYPVAYAYTAAYSSPLAYAAPVSYAPTAPIL